MLGQIDFIRGIYIEFLEGLFVPNKAAGGAHVVAYPSRDTRGQKAANLDGALTQDAMTCLFDCVAIRMRGL